MDVLTERRWFIVLSKPRQEVTAFAHLGRQGYEAWLPMCERFIIERRPRGAEKRKKVAAPLWPGYVFAAVEPGQPFTPILSTIGVRTVMGGRDGLSMLTGEALGEIRRLAEAGGAVWSQMSDPVRRIWIGRVLEVTTGPLQGQAGLCVEALRGRVTLVLDMMGRQTPVSFPNGSVREPAGTSAAVAFSTSAAEVA